MKCTYCGDIADSFDHVPPVCSYRTSRKGISWSKAVGIPACRECNSVLGGKGYLTIGTRAAHLATRYRERYKKLLSMPDWEDYELEELEYNLKVTILTSIKDKSETLARISICELTAHISPSKADIWSSIEDDDGIPDK